MGFLSLLLNKLFVGMPPIAIDHQEKEAYERLIQHTDIRAGVASIIYDCPYPKHRFVAYMAEQKGMLVHGSNNQEITNFETRRQTLYNGKYVNAVFATKDAIWPIFYAVFNRAKLVGNFRNGCLRINAHPYRYYFFSLTEQTFSNTPWTSGTVYFLPQQSFVRASSASVYFDEWVSEQEVSPLFKMEVGLEDFPLVSMITSHVSEESILKTWLLYKRRLRAKLSAISNGNRI